MKNKHIFDDLKYQINKTPIVVGKGPTCDRFLEFIKEKDRDKFITISINDAVKLYKNFNYAHFMDFEALERCKDYIKEIKLITPAILHKNEKISDINIVQCKCLDHFKYDASIHNKKTFPEYDCVNVKSRSSEAVISILGLSGFKKIVTFGINGGLDYGGGFEKIPRKKPWESHDIQFQTINEIKSMYNLQISFL